MRKFWPIIPIILGVPLIFGGFAYDVMFAGIPYPDPTPEMTARYARDAQIAATIMFAGLGTLLFGLVGGSVQLALFLLRRNR